MFYYNCLLKCLFFFNVFLNVTSLENPNLAFFFNLKLTFLSSLVTCFLRPKAFYIFTELLTDQFLKFDFFSPTRTYASRGQEACLFCHDISNTTLTRRNINICVPASLDNYLLKKKKKKDRLNKFCNPRISHTEHPSKCLLNQNQIKVMEGYTGFSPGKQVVLEDHSRHGTNMVKNRETWLLVKRRSAQGTPRER